jgi:hypothetical protein
VRALKEELPWEALESAARVCASSRQGQRAAAILEGAQAYARVSPATLLAIFGALLQESQADAALRLLQVCGLAVQCLGTVVESYLSCEHCACRQWTHTGRAGRRRPGRQPAT